MFKRRLRCIHNSGILCLLMHGLCVVLAVIALCLIFSFLSSHMGMLVGVAILLALIIILQWLAER